MKLLWLVFSRIWLCVRIPKCYAIILFYISRIIWLKAEALLALGRTSVPFLLFVLCSSCAECGLAKHMIQKKFTLVKTLLWLIPVWQKSIGLRVPVGQTAHLFGARNFKAWALKSKPYKLLYCCNKVSYYDRGWSSLKHRTGIANMSHRVQRYVQINWDSLSHVYML